MIKFDYEALEKKVMATEPLSSKREVDIYTEWAEEFGVERMDVKILSFHYFYTPDIVSLSSAKDAVRRALVAKVKIK